MSPLLENKIIVVIGGTSGLGLSAAKAFAHEGAKLIVLGRDDDHLRAAKHELNHECVLLPGDACDPASARTAIDEAYSVFGAFHGLYHVAGGSGRRAGDGPLHEITDEGWAFTIALNQTSVFYSNRAAISAWMEHGTPGAILNMTSVLAYSPSPTHFASHAYAAAKAAVIGMTRSAAAYYAPHNIRINALAPGCTDTPMAGRVRENAEVRQYLQRKQPLEGGRMGLPTDADGAAAFLLSDAAAFITGQVLAVDGGWSVVDAGA
jgi:NAD(P)-dependent dehydrogenase (short-subunit alcohol dehydrogenase family)